MTHSCGDCGMVHQLPGQLALDDAAAAPAVVEASPGPNENDVAIAEIEAQAEVATAKIYAATGDEDLRMENERLRGEIAGMRQGLEAAADAAAVEAPPAGAPIVVAPDPAPAPAAVEAPPAVEEHRPAEKKSTNYFGF